jgi:hypothetical protein
VSRPLRPLSVVTAALALTTGLLGPLGPAGASSTTPAARHAVTVTLSDAPTRAVLDRPVLVTGTVTDADRRPLVRARVSLQVRARRGWATPPGATTLTDGAGRFTLGAPTFYYGRHVYRASVATADTGAAASPARIVAVSVPYRPAGRAGAGRTEPTRFDPCTPIPYLINYAGAPRNARAMVAAALARARAATGLTFVYAGPYAGVPFSRGADLGLPGAGIGFAWSTPHIVPGLAGPTVGLGGGGWFTGRRRTSSGVVIDRTFHLRRGWTGPNSVGGLLLHELGHALGLEHVNDRRQQMYPRDIGAPNGNYNRGDLAALRRIGLEAGCL